LKEKNKLFWILQISGWVLLDFMYLILYYRNYFNNFKIIGGLVITHFCGFVVSLGLRQIYKRSAYKNKSIPFILILSGLGSVISANIWFWIDALASLSVNTYSEIFGRITVNSYLSNIWSNTFVMFNWSALYFSINFWYDFRIQKNRTDQANQLAQAAQLQMLRYQLNPHFLFNSLNSIRALIEEDKLRAKSMITELSEFLRYSLVSKNYSDVPLSSELEAIKHYLAIGKTRYEENLDIAYDIDSEAENFPVLSFLIHPVIENAIKYGMQTSKLPLHLKISAKVEDGKIKIEICNSGRWIESSERENMHIKSTGTGLNNVRARLQNAFPDNHVFEIKHDSEKVCVRIEITNNAKTV
jgi:two-component system, LytTR family, sensor kinase